MALHIPALRVAQHILFVTEILLRVLQEKLAVLDVARREHVGETLRAPLVLQTAISSRADRQNAFRSAAAAEFSRPVPERLRTIVASALLIDPSRFTSERKFVALVS